MQQQKSTETNEQWRVDVPNARLLGHARVLTGAKENFRFRQQCLDEQKELIKAHADFVTQKLRNKTTLTI
jgi:hypothetical protein